MILLPFVKNIEVQIMISWTETIGGRRRFFAVPNGKYNNCRGVSEAPRDHKYQKKNRKNVGTYWGKM